MTITLDELLQDIAAARQRMSVANPHRLLFQQCAEALIQLATKLEADKILFKEYARQDASDGGTNE